MDADIDAPPPPVDTGPTHVTLSQTTETTLSGNSIACGITAQDTTSENSWYRVFRLADAGVTRELSVISVSFGVQSAVGQPEIQVKLGTYAGSTQPPPGVLDTTLITPLNSASVTVPNLTNMMVNVPVSATVAADAKLVVEVFAPDLAEVGKFWLAGAAGDESAPAYMRAPTCDITQPTQVPTIAANANLSPVPRFVITVQGTY
ncbi:MAG: hypothetical protein GX539_14970 [Candidatus Cloacimonetes bacterium]|nr:hypothetical protein [Candidatus Cloacimonadota bacterium]